MMYKDTQKRMHSERKIIYNRCRTAKYMPSTVKIELKSHSKSFLGMMFSVLHAQIVCCGTQSLQTSPWF